MCRYDECLIDLHEVEVIGEPALKREGGLDCVAGLSGRAVSGSAILAWAQRTAATGSP